MSTEILIGATAGLIIGGAAGYMIISLTKIKSRQAIVLACLILGAMVGGVLGRTLWSAESYVTEIGSREEFDRLVLKADRPVLVDFYSTTCPPCWMLGPVLDSLSVEYKGRVVFVKVNVEKLPGIRDEYGVQGWPTVIVFLDSQPKSRIVGLADKENYRQAIDAILHAK